MIRSASLIESQRSTDACIRKASKPAESSLSLRIRNRSPGHIPVADQPGIRCLTASRSSLSSLMVKSIFS